MIYSSSSIRYDSCNVEEAGLVELTFQLGTVFVAKVQSIQSPLQLESLVPKTTLYIDLTTIAASAAMHKEP